MIKHPIIDGLKDFNIILYFNGRDGAKYRYTFNSKYREEQLSIDIGPFSKEKTIEINSVLPNSIEEFVTKPLF